MVLFAVINDYATWLSGEHIIYVDPFATIWLKKESYFLSNFFSLKVWHAILFSFVTILSNYTSIINYIYIWKFVMFMIQIATNFRYSFKAAN